MNNFLHLLWIPGLHEYAPRSVGSTRFFIFLLHLFTILVILLLTNN